MVTPQELFNLCVKNGLNFISGVPCSIFKEFLIYVNENQDRINHVRATSEGEAVGIAAGYHLSTGNIPIVYMQNSGFGNAVNPLTSLMDEKVYGIPAILFVTWRGEPGVPDEPQHAKMGQITMKLLETLDIPYEVAVDSASELEKQLLTLKEKTEQLKRPVALVFKKGIIAKDETLKKKSSYDYPMTREQALDILLRKIGNSPLISTTGKTSREIFELRETSKQSHENDFLTVGSMGCVSGIGLGIAQNCGKMIYVIDGDGAVLMKMGTLATIGKYAPPNFVHLIIDNNAYESTGGQPTVSDTLNWQGLLESVGYKKVVIAKNQAELEAIDFHAAQGPLAVIVKTKPGARKELGRPTQSPQETKTVFMESLTK